MFEKIVGAQVIGRANVSWKFVDCVSAGLESGKLSYFWVSRYIMHWRLAPPKLTSIPFLIRVYRRAARPSTVRLPSLSRRSLASADNRFRVCHRGRCAGPGRKHRDC